MNKFHYFFSRFIISILALLIGTTSMASVTMIGSRIIYKGENKSVDVQLRNRNDFPYVVQTWFDSGKMASAPDQSNDVPFIATPPVFRIQPNAGQVVRIIFNGAQALPQDRESVFYFNFLQVPPTNLNGLNNIDNKMFIILQNRVKLFYRPAAIAGTARNFFAKLEVISADSTESAGITIKNNQPYHLSLSDIQLSRNGQLFKADTEMIPPFTAKTFYFSGAKPMKNEHKNVTITIIDDQGARLSEQYQL